MENKYVAYLNSMNNANSSNENALAEAQISNPYFNKIMVERNLGIYLAEKVREKPISIILTGHAGDGKTSLVYQILRMFNLICQNEELKVHDELFSEELGKSIMYVKDMSELSEEDQDKLLKKSLNAKRNGNSSILVSNTGPLLNTFKRFNNSDEVEMQLLKLMDENKGEEANIDGEEILIINMARIDNVVLAPKLLRNLLSKELWAPCESCEYKSICPIFNNFSTLHENIENINKVVTAYYRWLFENDRRLTVRQILSHLSYSITGNLSCRNIDETISSSQGLEIKFNYNSSNLFFGYIGTHSNNEANQIKAIRELKNLKLDSKEINNDYAIFVRNDFGTLTNRAKDIAQYIWTKYNREYTYSSSNLFKDEKPYELRKSMRRMQILFGNYDEDSISQLYSNLFQPVYSDFLRFRSGKMNPKENRELKNKITKAIYFLFVGSINTSGNNDIIFLPLNRKGKGVQNSQLLQGKIERRDIKILQTLEESSFDKEENHYRLNIKVAKINEPFPISLMLLDYLDKVSKGAVSTRINPSLTHGIDKMKSELYEKYKFEQDTTTEILIHTNNGPKVISMEFDNNELFVE